MHQFDVVAQHLPYDSERDKNVVRIVLNEKNPDRGIHGANVIVLFFLIFLVAHSPPPQLAKTGTAGL
jgi:hypothetical protein